MASLDPDQMRQLSREIEHQYADLIREAREALQRTGGEDLPETGTQVLDSAERSVAELLAGLDAAQADRHMRLVGELIDARNRMRHGTYGVCEDCQADIGFARLQAEPAARRCVDCQGLVDRQAGGAGLPTL